MFSPMTMPSSTNIPKTKIMASRDITLIVRPEKGAIMHIPAKEMGIAAYVMKPIVKQEIAKTIRKVLDK